VRLWDDTDIIVLDEKERYLFSASKNDVRYHPAARLLGTDEDVALLTEALQHKQRMKNETVQIFKGLVEMQPHPKSLSKGEGLLKPKSQPEPKKKNAFKEYMKLCGIEPKIYSNPVEELLKGEIKIPPLPENCGGEKLNNDKIAR
jgi:hypothetical protein